MSVLVDEGTRVLVQGITGAMGRDETRRMLEYGTRVVAGVVPGRAGQVVHGVPVYDSIADAIAAHRVDASIAFVPKRMVRDAVVEAIESGIGLVCVPTEGVPAHDAWEMVHRARRSGCRILGPNSMGVASPGKARLGGIGGDDAGSGLCGGSVGVISRSGGMLGEICWELTRAGIGQSTAVSLGGGQILGTSFRDVLELFQADAQTDLVVMFGELGSLYEEEAAEYIARGGFTKPVVALIAGLFAERLPGVQFGHASAVIRGGAGLPSGKVAALRDAGATVVDTLDELVRVVGAMSAVRA